MTEPRMRLRQKGPQFPAHELSQFLIAFGDDDNPLPETVRCLDEIVTDYIIEACHEAASVAQHARRQKIKLDDFKYMLRRDTSKLGRVSEMLETDKELRKKRKAFDTDEGAVVKDAEGTVAGAGGPGADKAKDSTEKSKTGPEGDGERKKKKKKREKKGGDDASTVRSG
ncbi:TFIID-18kDa-domain-containing protein [Corynespora cassiicola Philippines]|uniref:Transcription initiation factor TFIID subunit 13 n=1 Tax=Corynespora cassiicola Philippines TaxID=1448308 RepID=A0A2T2NTB3_CORCC|nr:TFIID-18kDa-domain-containing protein [Corynespora cassiicola Philippines]